MTEWQVKKVGDIADTQLGKMLNKGKQSGKHAKPYLRTDNVHWGRFDLSEIKEMDILPEEQDKYLATKGDLLMCEGGASGRTAIWNEDYDISFQNHVHRIRPKDLKEISPKYLLYYFEWFIKNGFASDLIKGVTISSLSQSGLRSIEVTYPPIDEQHKIVELLEDHLSRLDAALTDVKQARIKSAQFRQSLLNSVFYGYKFKSVSLGACIELIMGQAPPGITCNKNGEGTPFVKVGEFAKLYPTIEEWTIKPLRLAKKGDVLICVVGATVGKINLGIDCAIGRSVAAIRPKNTLLQKYLYYFLELKMLEIRGQSKGSAQGVITKDFINSIQIPLPELKAQQDVLDLLELNFSQIEKSIEVSNIIEHDSLSLRRSLLQAAFTGQLAKEVVSV